MSAVLGQLVAVQALSAWMGSHEADAASCARELTALLLSGKLVAELRANPSHVFACVLIVLAEVAKRAGERLHGPDEAPVIGATGDDFDAAAGALGAALEVSQSLVGRPLLMSSDLAADGEAIAAAAGMPQPKGGSLASLFLQMLAAKVLAAIQKAMEEWLDEPKAV